MLSLQEYVTNNDPLFTDNEIDYLIDNLTRTLQNSDDVITQIITTAA